jgi:hypothetical protein
MEWKLNPDWLSEPSWQEVAVAADRLTPVQIEAALAKLGEWFAASWVKDCTLRHPVAGKQLTYVGRLSLLELAHSAVVAGADESFSTRLRDAEQFLGADAELRTMLLLKLSGAELERAPQGIGPRLSEFVAKWRSGARTVVEVKAVRMSNEVELAERLTSQAVFALGAAAGDLPGFTGRVEWNEDALFGAPPSVATLEKEVAESLASAKSMAQSLSEFSVALGAIGTLWLKANSSILSLEVAYDGYAPTAGGIFRRVRRRCNDALQQLATHPTLPGLIILDIDADGLARNGLSLLARWAAAKPQLGAVLVVAREYSARRSYGHVCVLPGPRLNELADVLVALESCEAGHLHFQPLCARESPCPALFALL